MLDLNHGRSAPPPSSRGAHRAINALIFVGACVAFLFVAMIVLFFHRANSLKPRALRVSGNSMCPAICVNERVIVAPDAYDKRPPERGEVILFYREQSRGSLLKRVIGVGGDTVEPGPGNSILVNGKGVVLPGACGGPIRAAIETSGTVQFRKVTVPDNSFFVIGDNLNNSLDSRSEKFGFVRRDQVLGKAMFIYLSDISSRIGCVIQ